MTLYILYILVSILIIPTVIYAIVVQTRVSSIFNAYSKVNSKKNLRAEDVAQSILDSENINDVKITKITGHLTDHYHPKKKYIALSKKVYNSTSIGSIGIAAHECGHAVQHKQNYLPAKIRGFFAPIVSLVSWAFIPLFLLGIVFSVLGYYVGPVFIYIAVGTYALTTLFYLVTLPVEIDASKRAMKKLEELNILDEQERADVKKVLSAAAQTYIAAFLISLLSFLRFALWTLMMVGKRK